MSDRSAVAYLYDGTFEGLMTAGVEAYAHRPSRTVPGSGRLPAPIRGTDDGRRRRRSPNDRVIAGTEKSWGRMPTSGSGRAFRCEQRERGQWIYDYVRLGMEAGRRIDLMLTDDRVIRLHKWSGLVSLESARFVQFVRFPSGREACITPGIEPEYDVVALMMPHFADRAADAALHYPRQKPESVRGV